MTKPIARDPIYRRRRFDAEIIELCVRWYITYRLSYRDLVAMMAERGIAVSHTTIHRWVIRYVPEFEKRWNRFARPVNNSCRCASMGGFKSFTSAAITLAGIELAHRIRKRQFSLGRGRYRNFGSLKQIWERALA
jgi:transposase-like protein